MYDWNDLKAFLAVAETGSTLSAAQALPDDKLTGRSEDNPPIKTATCLPLINASQNSKPISSRIDWTAPYAQFNNIKVNEAFTFVNFRRCTTRPPLSLRVRNHS